MTRILGLLALTCHAFTCGGGDDMSQFTAVFRPAPWGLSANTGVVPPPLDGAANRDPAIVLHLPASEFPAGSHTHGVLRIIRQSGNAPLAYSFIGKHSSVGLYCSLVVCSTEGRELTRARIQDAPLGPHLRSAVIGVVDLSMGEHLDLPFVVQWGLPTGDYDVRPALVADERAGRQAGAANIPRWGGKVVGEAVRIRVVDSSSKQQSLRAWSIRCTKEPREDRELQPNKPLECRLTMASIPQICDGRTYDGEVSLTTASVDGALLYSPVGWHRSLAGLEMSLVWTPKWAPDSSMVCPIADPPELHSVGATSEGLLAWPKKGTTVNLPFIYSVPQQPGDYEVRCLVRFAHYFTQAAGYTPTWSSNVVKIRVDLPRARAVPEPAQNVDPPPTRSGARADGKDGEQ